jgi:hypothetical protein
MVIDCICREVIDTRGFAPEKVHVQDCIPCVSPSETLIKPELSHTDGVHGHDPLHVRLGML